MVNLIINGVEKSIKVKSNILDLIVGLNKDPKVLVVELNGVILKQPDWQDTVLNQGDIIELISFVGGG